MGPPPSGPPQPKEGGQPGKMEQQYPGKVEQGYPDAQKGGWESQQQQPVRDLLGPIRSANAWVVFGRVDACR